MKLLVFWKKEIIQMIRNPRMVAVIFFMPILQMLLVSFAMNNEPQNIRLAVDCTANDYLVQKIYDKAIASGWFSKIDAGDESPFAAIQKGHVDAAIIAPPGGFTKSVGAGDAKLQLLIDATNIIKAQAIEAYLNAIVTSVIKESRLVSSEPTSVINFKNRVLFNPEMSSRFFMLPFIIVIMCTMTILSTVCISMTREKECGTMEMLISAPIKKVHIILGKTIPYIGVGAINLVTIVTVSMLVFDMPFRGSIWQFVLAFLVFAASTSAFGILLSTFCAVQLQAMLGMMIFLFLSIMLSGGIAPIDNMPPFLRIFAYAMPLSHYTFLARNILLKGSDWGYFLAHLLAIFAFGLLSATFAMRRLKTTL
ncbi:MAG: ABC transporter permease [Holosporaceae bacterium]|jgi:ABC-2 type transport system permease protein|nr:ABC transporter permease [Holosporaceae bacterium]